MVVKRQQRTASLRKIVRRYLAALLIAAILLIAVGPYAWLVLTSFKTRIDALSPTPTWFFVPTLRNYQEAFLQGDFGKYLLNTLVIALGSTSVSLLVGTPAAYALTRFTFPGKNVVFFYTLATRMLPAIVLALPLFLVFIRIGLYGTPVAVIVAHSAYNVSVVIWMMRGFFTEVPVQLDEAALLDGHSRWGAFVRIILPLSLSGLAATAIVSFMWSWNEFLYALVLTNSPSRTITVGVASLVTPFGTAWGQIAAAATVAAVPIVLFTFFVQRRIVQGATLGAVKG